MENRGTRLADNPCKIFNLVNFISENKQERGVEVCQIDLVIYYF